MATPFRRTRFPVPPGGGGGGGQFGGQFGGQPQSSGQGGAQASSQPSFGQVQVQFPDASALLTRVLSIQPRTADPVQGSVFYWPTAGALGISVLNTLDVPVRCAVHVNIDQNTAQLLKAPILEFDVGANERMNPTVDPGAGDGWAPYAWVRCTPLGVPTVGGIEVSLVRRGA